MNIQQNSIKSGLKLQLIDYFESLQFEIDANAQHILSLLTENDEERRQGLLARNREMIKLVQEALESNIKQINKYEFENNSQIVDELMFTENLKKNLFKKYCFYAKPEWENSELNHFSLGILLVTDWYLDLYQLDFLRSFFKCSTLGKNFDNEERILIFDSDVLILYYKLNSKNKIQTDWKLNGNIMKLQKKTIIKELNLMEELEIILDYFALIALEENLFKYFINLKQLSFYLNETSSTRCLSIIIKERSFNGLIHLETLSIDVNNLFIAPNSFRQMPNLRSIYFNCLQFTPQNKNEQIIKLANYFDHLAPCINSSLSTHDPWTLKNDLLDDQKNLEELKIFFDKLEGIEGLAFKNLRNLRKLCIRSIDLKYLPSKCFAGLISIEVLAVLVHNNLNNHYLREPVSDLSFEYLENLIELRIEIPNLSSLNKYLFRKLNKLQKLDIFACCVKDISNIAFYSCVNLKEMNICITAHHNDNQNSEKTSFESLEIKKGTFINQSKLEKLSIFIELVEMIEDSALDGLANLKRLEISSLKLKKISKNILKGLNSLEELIINYQLKSTFTDLNIEEDSFEELINLKKLRFNVNKLPNLSERLFKNQTNLETLIICVDNIGQISKNAFKQLENLKFLSISKIDNSSTHWSSEQLDGLKIKEHFGLPGNRDIHLRIMKDIRI